MLNPEDFRRRLNEALVGRQKAVQEEVAAEEAHQQKAVARVQEEENKLQGEKEARNQMVTELDVQLPIQQYLETLRDQIAPKQEVHAWRAKDGKMPYALVYSTKIRKVLVEYKSGSAPGPRGCPGTADIRKFGLRVARDVLGVVLNWDGQLLIQNERIVNNSYYENDIYPLYWGCFSWERAWDKSFSITSPGGLQQFAQALTEFYVGPREGQGKYS